MQPIKVMSPSLDSVSTDQSEEYHCLSTPGNRRKNLWKEVREGENFVEESRKQALCQTEVV